MTRRGTGANEGTHRTRYITILESHQDEPEEGNWGAYALVV